MSETQGGQSTVHKAKTAEEIEQMEGAVNKVSKRKVSLKQVEMELAMVQDAVDVVNKTMDVTGTECEVKIDLFA